MAWLPEMGQKYGSILPEIDQEWVRNGSRLPKIGPDYQEWIRNGLKMQVRPGVLHDYYLLNILICNTICFVFVFAILQPSPTPE